MPLKTLASGIQPEAMKLYKCSVIAEEGVGVPAGRIRRGFLMRQKIKNIRKMKNNSCHFVILILKWGEDMEKE